MKRWLLGLVILLGRVTMAAPPPLDPIAAAKLHFRLGATYFDNQQYEQALVEYQTSYRLVPNAGVLFNIGTAHHHLGHKKEALDYYRRYLAAEPKGPVAREARGYVAELTRETASEEARRKSEADAARLAEEARRKREEAATLEAEQEWKQAEEVVRRAGEAKRKEKAAAQAAAALQRKEEETKRKAQAAAQAAAALERKEEEAKRAETEKAARQPAEVGSKQETKPAATEPSAATPETPPSSGRSLRLAGIGVLAAGVVLGLGGAGFQLAASSKANAINDQASMGAPFNPSLDQERQTFHLLYLVSYVVGGVAVAGGAVLLGLSYAKERREPSRPSAVLVPWLGPERAGLGLNGRF